MSKPKSNSILDSLPENQRAQVESWLFEENISYKDCADRLLADFNVRCAPSSIGDWYQKTAQTRMMDRIAASRAQANAVVDQVKKNPADMYEALVSMVGQLAFESAMDGKKFDPEMLFNFTKLVMTARKQELEAQTLALAKDKFQFDAAKAVRNHMAELTAIHERSDLDDDAKLEQIRFKLFGEVKQ